MNRWRLVPFHKAVKDCTAGTAKTPQSEYLPQGSLAVIDQGKELIGGFTDSLDNAYKGHLPVIIFGDHTRVFKYVDFPFTSGGEGVLILESFPGFEPRFLYHYFRSRKIPGRGYSRHFKLLKELEIPQPSIADQRRVAEILDQADELRAMRQRTIDLLDELAQCIFLDMFGDPASTLGRWPAAALGELSTVFSDGPFGSNLKSSHYRRTGVRVIRLQNIGVGEFIDDDAAFISEEHFAGLAKHSCRPGDVIIGTLGDPNLRAFVQPPTLELALNKADCVQMRVDPNKATPAYISAVLNQPSVESMAQSLIHGQTRKRISMGKLRSLEVPVPPLELQKEFGHRIAALNDLRARQRQNLTELDGLFTSLQGRTFHREL